MDDGVVLLADRYVARGRAARRRPCSCARPTAGAARSGSSTGALLAERGFQVVVQSVRGTFGSGGDVRARSTSAPTGWPRCAG